jgi:hypothetical protein
MNPYRNWIEPTGRSLSGHLERLRVTQLRQALATLLRQPGEAQDIIDARHGLDDRPRLADPYRRTSPLHWDWGQPERLDGGHQRGESPWDRREGTDWRGQWYDEHDEYGERGENDEHDEVDEPDRAEQSTLSGWRAVLAAWCRLAAWLLGRLARPGRVLAALGVGLATALAVWLAGPPAAPGPLSALTDAVTCGADALARLGTC